MASILDNAIIVGKETTYGTAATLTRSYEGQGDGWVRKQDALQSVGMRAGMKTVRSDRRRQILMGAEGKLELDFLNIGMGLLLQGLFSTTTGPTVVSGAAYTQAHSVGASDSGVSYTVQMLRTTSAATSQQFTYSGCVPTKWSLAQKVGELAKLSVDFDAMTEETTTAAGTPVYPAASVPFDWTQAVVSIGGTPVDFKEFEVSADLGMKTDRRFLRGSALKRQPRRAAVPTYTGKLSGEFADLAAWTAFSTGAVQSLKIEWTGALIAASNYHKVTLDIPAVQYDGDTPQASLSDLSSQDVPFTILDDGTNPPIKLTVVSTDAAL